MDISLDPITDRLDRILEVLERIEEKLDHPLYHIEIAEPKFEMPERHNLTTEQLSHALRGQRRRENSPKLENPPRYVGNGIRVTPLTEEGKQHEQ